MASTYSDNNGLEKPGDGEQSGTWGQTVNTNIDLLDEALEGQVTVTLPAIGTTGAPNSFAIADGSTAAARHRYVTFVDSGDLGGTAYAQLTPNNAEKLYFVKNSLSASRSLVLFQGTYNAGRAVTVAAGEVLLIGFDGAGATGTCTRLAQLPLNTGTIVSQDSNSVSVTGGTITGVTFGSASVTITGGTISGTTITGLAADLSVADGGTGASTASAARSNLGLAIGTNVQGWDTNLDQIAALAPTDGNFVVGNGAAWVAESDATVRTSLGLGSIATQDSSSVTITGGTVAGITDLAIVDGGTGASSASAARTNLGLVIGTDVQAQDAGLQAIATATITGVSGADADVITGTAGTSGNVATWDANGDLVDGGAVPTVSASGTFTVTATNAGSGTVTVSDTCYYTRINNIVHVYGRIRNVAAVGTDATTRIFILGLPFDNRGGTDYTAYREISANFSGVLNRFVAYLGGGQNNLEILNNTGGSPAYTISTSGNDALFLDLHYPTDDPFL